MKNTYHSSSCYRRPWRFVLGAVFFSLVVQSCALDSVENSGEDRINCRDQINDSIFVHMTGTIEDVGFTDMFFHRTIYLIKGKDSLRVDLSTSQFQSFRAATIKLEDSTSRIVLFNRENPDFKVINPNDLTLEQNPSVTEPLIGGHVHILTDNSKLICPIPGTRQD